MNALPTTPEQYAQELAESKRIQADRRLTPRPKSSIAQLVIMWLIVASFVLGMGGAIFVTLAANHAVDQSTTLCQSLGGSDPTC